MASKINPQQDTGWGLIFRLNALFSEVEELAPLGKYDEWNFKLDRIWSNLVYRNPIDFQMNKNDEIISVKFDDKDIKEKDFLDTQILKAKGLMTIARNHYAEGKEYARSKEWIKAKKQLYKSILIKEIWLRKFMYELGLYLKEVEHNPAGAMWGK